MNLSDEFKSVTCDITDEWCDISKDCNNCEIALEYEKNERMNECIFNLEYIEPTKLIENDMNCFVNNANTIAKFKSLTDVMIFLENNNHSVDRFKKFILEEEIANLNNIYLEWWKFSNWFNVRNIEYYMFDEPTKILIVVTTNDIYAIAPRIEVQ